MKTKTIQLRIASGNLENVADSGTRCEERNSRLQFLEAHASNTPSKFMADAQWRKDNESWLRWSRQLATALIGYMQDNNIKRAELAQRLDVSPQYVSRLLSGKENLSFKSIAHIEEHLGLNCMSLLAI